MATRLNNSGNCFKSCAILGDGGTIASSGDNNELRCGEVSCSTPSSSHPVCPPACQTVLVLVIVRLVLI